MSDSSAESPGPSSDVDAKTLRQAMRHALNLISYRQRTEHELRDRLSERFPPAAIDRTIARLKDQGLVDDAQFAREWSAGRTRHSPRSARALVWEMTRKGVAQPVAEAAVMGLDDEQTVRVAADKFARRLSGASYEQFHRRLWQHLQRRGYTGSVARRATLEMWNSQSSEE